MSTTYDLAILSHHKCATNWLRGICRELVSRDLASVDILPVTSPQEAGLAGGCSILLDVNASYAPGKRVDPLAQPCVHFVRDPRDAFVSNYWSWLKSHQNNGEMILKFREKAADLSVEDGMILLVDLFPMAAQLASWPEEMWAQTVTVKYEDLLRDFENTLKEMLAVGG